MGGDSAPRNEIAGAVEALTDLPDGFLIQLVGRPERDRGGARPASRGGPEPHRDPRGGRRHRHEREAPPGHPQETQIQHGRRPRPPARRALRRVHLRRQYRRHARRLHHAARPARRCRARHRGHAVSHRLRARPGARRRRQRRLLRPRAGRLRLPRHRLHARRHGPAQARWSGCSTWARRRRRATRSSGRRTSSSSGPLASTTSATSRAATFCRARSSGCRRRGGVRRVRRERRAQVLRIVGAGVRRPAEGADSRTCSAGRRWRTSTGSSTTPTYGGAPLLGVKGVPIICHGASTANAIKNAIRVAVQAARSGLSQHIGAEFALRDGGARHDPPSLRRGRQRRHGGTRPACSPTTTSPGCSTRPTSGSSSAPASASGGSPGRSRPSPC